MDHFKVDLVCHGASSYPLDLDGKDPYEVCQHISHSLEHTWLSAREAKNSHMLMFYSFVKVPKNRGKFQIVKSGNDLTTLHIVDRILKNRYDYMLRNNEKEMKEVEFVKSMANSPENNSDANNNHEAITP